MPSPVLLACAGLCLALAATLAAGQTVGVAIRLKPGDAKVRAQIARHPGLPADLREIIAERFDWALVDLDGDGRRELIVVARDSAYCGSAGCSFSAYLLDRGPMKTLFGGYVTGALATTAETYGGLRGIVALDDRGAIQRDPRSGRPLVFSPEGAAQDARPAGTAAPPP